jgi:hypothetical protein
MAPDSASRGSAREAIRWGLLLAGVVVGGARIPRIWMEAREWRRALLIGDPSEVDAYRTFFTVDVIGVLIVFGLSAGFFYLLRQRTKSAA